MDKIQVEEFLRVAYAAILGRPIDMHGLNSYTKELLSSSLTHADVLSRLMNSQEGLASRREFGDYSLASDDFFTSFFTENIKSNSINLKLDKFISYDEFIGKVAEFGLNSGDYFVEHSRRFYEIACAIHALIRTKPAESIKVLDFGAAHTANILSVSYDDRVSLYDCNIMRDLHLPEIVKHQFVVNLEKDNIENIKLDDGFDVLIFSEVLEHLRVNPYRIFNFFKNNLKSDGNLILTTPNFFRAQNVKAFYSRSKMQPYVSANTSYENLHSYHVREYCCNEILQISKDVGLKLDAFWFSDCWDDPSVVRLMPEDQLANLFFVFSKV